MECFALKRTAEQYFHVSVSAGRFSQLCRGIGLPHGHFCETVIMFIELTDQSFYVNCLEIIDLLIPTFQRRLQCYKAPVA